jgi:hypothetical protein
MTGGLGVTETDTRRQSCGLKPTQKYWRPFDKNLSRSRVMKWWLFTFQTYHRRELGDYKYTIEIKDHDSFTKAVREAVQQLPLGEEGNAYSRQGVAWELVESRVLDDEIPTYTNDK